MLTTNKSNENLSKTNGQKKNKKKSLKKKFVRIFKSETNDYKEEVEEFNNYQSKSKSKSLKSTLKAIWKRNNGKNQEEKVWLLGMNRSSQLYSSMNDIKKEDKPVKDNDKTVVVQNGNTVKPSKEVKKSMKLKRFGKRVGKMTVKACKYISMGSTIPGYMHNPTVHYNYETQCYEYYSNNFNDCQSVSPSMFF